MLWKKIFLEILEELEKMALEAETVGLSKKKLMKLLKILEILND